MNFDDVAVLPYRIKTYEHEALWGKALTSYDLHTSLPEVTRQVGILEVKHARVCASVRRIDVSAAPLSASPTGPAELWLEQHPYHLHEGSGERRGGVWI